jgi:hypothetical protein
MFYIKNMTYCAPSCTMAVNNCWYHWYRRRKFPFRKPPGSPVTISVTTFGVRHIPIMTRIVTGDSGSLRNGKLRRRSLANSVFICFIIAKYLRLSKQNIFLFLATVGTGECRRLMKTSL